ncbi:MAG: glycosyltransferase [Actinomycetia bacterium]|nr:glycosyltransferase [Actinomycetes bacterium]MCP4960999.1 glycosyltransferase [Actinomycetes bacterium]
MNGAAHGERRRPGMAADPEGGILLVGEDAPGALLSSLRPGFEATAPTTVMNPLAGARELVGLQGPAAAVRRRVASRSADDRLIETVEQLRPDAVMLIKGRGISADAITRIRSTGTRVLCYYPDNPAWRGGDPGAGARLVACDTAILWSTRQADLLATEARAVEVVPFGYDANWFPLASPGGNREGIAFLGTWSPRRERFLAALDGLPLRVAGTGWATNSAIGGGDPIVETNAGEVLRTAAIGINLLHPQCAGAHNMRTREIAACGALQITDPGLDGTPLTDGESCLWFSNPQDLRRRVESALENPIEASEMARKAQFLIADDTYVARGRDLASLTGID